MTVQIAPSERAGPIGRRAVSVRRRGGAKQFLGLPALLLLGIVYLIPMFIVLGMSFDWPKFSVTQYAGFFEYGAYIGLLVRTIVISLIAVLISLFIGFPLAYAIAFSKPGVRKILMLCVLMPFVTSIIVRTFGFMVLLGRLGPVTEFTNLFGIGHGGFLQTPVAVVAGFVNFLLPLMVVPLVNTMREIDPAVLRSGQSLGAGSAYIFFRVFVPMTAPGIQAGCILTFVYGVGAFITPELLGGQSGSMIGSQIQVSLNQLADFNFAAAMATILSVIVLLALVVYRLFLGGSVAWLVTRTGGAPSRGRRRARLTPRFSVTNALAAGARVLDSVGHIPWRFGCYLVSAVGLLVMIVPGIIAIPISFSGTRALVFPPHGLSLQWYREFFTSEWLLPLRTSLIVAVIAAVVGPMLSLGAALAAERSASRWLRSATSVLLLMPAVVPAVVAALAFYLVFLRLNLNDTLPGLIIAITCMVIPFSYAIISAAVRALDIRYDRAAESLGASTFVVLRRVTMPMLKPSILSSMAITFLLAFDESAVSIFLSGLNVSTLSNQMFNATLQQSDPTIGVVGTLVLASILIFMGVQGLVRRLARTSLGSVNHG